MTNWDDEKMHQLTEQLNEISVPKQALEQARINAQRQNRRHRKKIRRTWQTVALIVTIFFVFVTSVRVSPAFANAVSKIPGLSPIIELIAFDKGLEDIVANDYYEEILMSETQNELTFTLLGVIADETGMLLSYKIASPNDLQGLTLDHLELELMHGGNPIEAGVGYGWTAHYEPIYEIENTINVTATEPIDYSNRNFELNFKLQKGQEMTFSIPFTLKKEIVKTKHYVVDEKVMVDGQTIEVKSLEISPLRAGIKIAIDPNNTMQILQFNEMKLIDEKGEDWGKIQNGTIGFGGIRDGVVTLFMQSNYFREPKNLTLVIPEIEALPKGEDFITVDFDKQQVLYQPEILDFTIQFKNRNTFFYLIRDVNKQTTFFSQGVDAEGKAVFERSSWRSESDNLYEVGSQFEANEGVMINPVKIMVNSFPNYLKGELKVEVPLGE
ncbi:DUF4179 domain-containing protein [Solibacillus sp. R5-41]|uniref:DUF4179 domain-containing protein n=1 Tax=Solibacillus sp. R5-41 TaxID=2048654 RepID=UPI0012FDEFAA|nr:DUF4179 domain-containing protein [Solibacillus sp. R5-41]